MKVALILGNQLVADHPLFEDKIDTVIMIEAQDLCKSKNYHSHKLVLILAGMRQYRAYLQSRGIKVIYKKLEDTPVFDDALLKIVREQKISSLRWMKSSDVGPNERLTKLAKTLDIGYEIYENNMFLTPESHVRDWMESHPKAYMETFYRHQRRRMNVLMHGSKPVGGQWNYDAQNRKPLPKKGLSIPSLPAVSYDDMTKEVITLVETHFKNHPGDANEFWLPVTHNQANRWLDDFVKYRLGSFGEYEDAMAPDEPFLFHSVLSPLINCGLLHPQKVLDAVLASYEAGDVSIASTEGFVRQLIGWREFMYGLYLANPAMKTNNYFGFTKPLEDWWYTEKYKSQNLPPPLIGALDTVHSYGYNHHIERLMVLGNWFLINEYDPHSVYEWFSSLYVDAYEWVMVPNVIGMSQYADGGRTATKPYISGGNYLQKMGRWWPSTDVAQKSDYTRLYWEFLDHTYDKLKNNFRLGLVLKQVEQRRSKKK